jgi:hypothetical protein
MLLDVPLDGRLMAGRGLLLTSGQRPGERPAIEANPPGRHTCASMHIAHTARAGGKLGH